MKGWFGHYYVFSFFKLLTFLNVTKCLKIKFCMSFICMIFFLHCLHISVIIILMHCVF